jgi:hypothetical protein
VFWGYDKSFAGGIRWMPKEAFAKKCEKEIERNQAYRAKNQENLKEYRRAYKEKNRGKLYDLKRRRILRISFKKNDGASLQCWMGSLKRDWNTFRAIANLTPNPGQTIAELIHELSGYPMEVCEQIANPPEPEILVNPGPDLF